jgi:5S rRNA maturation endonuclease (ribonuclease M5)
MPKHPERKRKMVCVYRWGERVTERNGMRKVEIMMERDADGRRERERICSYMSHLYHSSPHRHHHTTLSKVQ